MHCLETIELRNVKAVLRAVDHRLNHYDDAGVYRVACANPDIAEDIGRRAFGLDESSLL